eukprot:Clim_evm25s88 gene=Clim_evmTU25s88
MSTSLLARMPARIFQSGAVVHRTGALRRPCPVAQRSVYMWIEYIFNRVDYARIKEVGPDRACLEYILRQEGRFKVRGHPNWIDHERDVPVGKVTLTDVDMSGRNCTSNGVRYFHGCDELANISFRRCPYFDDAAVKNISDVYALRTLDMGECPLITKVCLEHLEKMQWVERINLDGTKITAEDLSRDLSQRIQL